MSYEDEMKNFLNDPNRKVLDDTVESINKDRAAERDEFVKELLLSGSVMTLVIGEAIKEVVRLFDGSKRLSAHLPISLWQLNREFVIHDKLESKDVILKFALHGKGESQVLMTVGGLSTASQAPIHIFPKSVNKEQVTEAIYQFVLEWQNMI